ncbi:hypothetical protein A2Z33_00335, partial [Candidatus Gottesmanbacteria bacterium RBG_16_52_11]
MNSRITRRLGKAFPDALISQKRKMKPVIPFIGDTWWLGVGRVLLFTVLLFLCFFILFIRLFHLTIIRGHEYRALADGNRIRELVRHAPRGQLLDRTGKPVAVNEAQYRRLLPCEAGRTANGACVSYLTQAEGEALEKTGLPVGSFLETDWKRRYVLGSATAHILGTTGEITAGELKDEYYQLRNYRTGDRIGRSGVEAIYEDRLRGRDGKELVEVDASGRILRVLGRDTEVTGIDIILSIDAGLSQVVAQAFPEGKRGAIIVSKPATGEILAMYSSPSYDPNLMSTGLSEDEYRKLADSSDRPMFNRAIGGVYPPGSTFKIVTAVAGLEEGAITGSTEIEDTGIISVGPFSFTNWYFTQYGRTEGMVNVIRALQRSNDIFFYRTGERTGIERLAVWARRMGLGSLTGIELPGEAAGLMPDPDWKSKHFTTDADLEARNNLWYAGDTYHIAIGQGYILTTPLQTAVWTDIIAAGGRYCVPTIEKVHPGISSGPACQELPIKKETLSLVTDGMVKA